jgi:hypothetical protein
MKQNTKHMKIKFLKAGSPLGFGYHENEEADLNEATAKELIELKYAIEVEQIRTADEAEPKAIKKAVKK